jgi:4-aminobutyrate aminotransferase
MAKIFTHQMGAMAQNYIERDAKVISPSYTRDFPLVVSHARGSELWDMDGKRYVDMTTGIAVNATGHSHPKVVQAIKDQADKFIHMAGTDFYYPVQIELGERLAEIAPFNDPARVFFGNSGTEAIEGALKLARYYTGRPQFIGFLRSFHGRTLGALAATSSKPVQRARYFPMMPGFTHVPYPDPYRPVLNMDGYSDYGERVVDYIEHEIFQTIVPAQEVAGILVEPIQGEGGYVVPPDGFFPALRALCDKYGILLIVDEVQAGIGRTGKWWGIQHFGVEPDIITSAKGIASGMPLGAIIARDHIMATWEYGAHASTFGGNPISCAAALATLELLGDKDGRGGMIENAAEVGQYMMDALEEISPHHPSIGQVRGKGMMIGIELVKDRSTKIPAKDLRNEVVHQAFDNGLLVIGCGTSTLRLMPALNTTREIADEALQILDEVLTQAETAHNILPTAVK